jgi:phage shock protein C
MKKTININLVGQPYIIDESAYEILHTYFEALKLKFTNEAEQKEILSDIEARVAEVFTQRLGKNRSVVNEEDVIYVTSLLGKPEDIAGETETTNTNSGDTKVNTSSSSTYTGPREKKLFRDTENKFVGGVISGLCHYFGWGDPTWIRLAVVGLVVLSHFAHLSLGFPIGVVYFILLIVIPKAQTSAEKLQMRGEPVTLQNIEKEVRDAMSTAAGSVSNMVNKNDPGNKVLGALQVIGRGFAKIATLFVLAICFLLMLALVLSFSGLSLLSSASLSDITHLVVANRYTIMLFNIGLLLTFGIPLVSVMYDAIRFLADSRTQNKIFKRVLGVLWIVGFIILGISGWSVGRHFIAADTINEKVQLMTPANGTLRVQLADTLGHALELKGNDEDEFSSFVHISGLSKTDYGFAFNDLKVEIAVSPDSNYYVEKVAFSRGSSIADATKNIKMMRYKFSQTDSTLNLDDKFELPNEGKWRGQRIKIRIYVPEGKRITFADNVDQVETSVKGNDYFDDMLADKTLQIEAGKVKCLNCKEKTIIDESNDEDADAPDAPDAPEAPEAPEAPNAPHKAHGGKNEAFVKDDLKDVSVTINQSGVSITGKNEKDEKVKVKINSSGTSVMKTDTLGNTKVTKK